MNQPATQSLLETQTDGGACQDVRGACAPRTVPVVFLDEVPVRKLAVDRRGLQSLLGLDGRTPKAARQAVWRFCAQHGIKAEDGGIYSIWKVQQALRKERAAKGARK